MATMIADLPQGRPESSLRRRIGRFSLSSLLVELEPEAVRTVLAGCVVLRAEAIYHTQTIDYVAYHAEFDEVPRGLGAPLYRCELTKHPDDSVTRRFIREPGT
jgi:hypothetical protein